MYIMKNTYEVTLFFHTSLTVSVKADNEESAIKIAESAGIDKGRLLEMAMNAVKDGSSEVRLVKTGEQEKKEKIESYTRAPWHEAKKELPSFGGARCVCYMPMYGCEVEMVFHRSRPDSGYKDFFVESAKGGRAYDWNYIQYWRYFNEN